MAIGARFSYRHAYARSSDSRAVGAPGQDYLALREDGRRLAFTLCDGVGQSFYGDLAARHLGNDLIEWLWDRPAAALDDGTALRIALLARLQALTAPATAAVAAVRLPAGIAPLLRDVLEEKRALGSESMFVAGLLDTDAGWLVLAWMGDSRVRLWGRQGEWSGEVGDAFRTRERWSSRRGPIGEAHVFVAPLDDPLLLAAYSDGLAHLDRATHPPRDAVLDAIIAAAAPGCDDLSFLEIAQPPSDMWH